MNGTDSPEFTGSIKFINYKSKFGFVIRDEDGSEYYFSTRDLPKDWNAQDKVSFRLKEAKKGDEAYDLKKV